MNWDTNKDNARAIIERQLEIFFKCTDFYEREIIQLHVDWTSDHDPAVKAKLLEANVRYNYLARQGKAYLDTFRWEFPKIFADNVTEFKIREGWYDPYLKDLKQ